MQTATSTMFNTNLWVSVHANMYSTGTVPLNARM